jgi:hypothetical protein
MEIGAKIMKKKFKAILIKDDKTSGCGINLPFNPKEIFGKARAPVEVTINGHTFQTTTFCMGGRNFIGVSKVNRDGAGIAAGDKITVTMELDIAPRVITPPADFAKALKANKRAQEFWDKLSYSHQREYANWISEAKRPETRLRRIEKAVELLGSGVKER